jgi:hypothetical protein
MMESAPLLTALTGPDEKKFYSLDQPEIALGRDSGNSIPILWDSSVSRKHARIFQRAGLFWIEDLGSTNRTYISMLEGEEREISPHAPALLLEGSRLRLGKKACFQVRGLFASYDKSGQQVMRLLHTQLYDFYVGLENWSTTVRVSRDEWIQNLETRLYTARDEGELLKIASEDAQEFFPDLGKTVIVTIDALPPLPEDLLDLKSDAYPNSIRNFFKNNIERGIFDEDENDE